jgi:hypothetical protein
LRRWIVSRVDHPFPIVATTALDKISQRNTVEIGAKGWVSMPLTRGKIGGYNSERLAFTFTMLNGGDTVECQISDAAMDELAGTRGTPSIARQGQFVALRDEIEKIASDLFDAGPIVKGGTIRIFTKHIQR